MSKSNKSKLVSFITLIVVLLLLVVAVGAICHFAGIGKDDITDIVNPVFRIEYDGKVYKTDTDNSLALPNSGQARFEVKGVDSFTVKVAPNVTEETDFTYTVNGQTYSYLAEKDLTAVFDLKFYDNAFALDMGTNYGLENVLARIWGTDDIIVGEHGNFPLYKIVVTASNGEIIEMPFGVSVTGISIPDHIVF